MTYEPGKSPFIKNLIPGLPERGKIKIGIKGELRTSNRGNEFQPPKKLDHFIVTTLERGKDGNFLRDEEMHKTLGEKPRNIPVMLLYNDPVLNFQSRYTAFKGRKLWCSGDGGNAYRQDGNGKKLISCPCPLADPDYTGNDSEPKCKMSAVLSVIIRGTSTLGGVWKFRTTSFNSIRNIWGQLLMYHTMSSGHIAGIAFNLTVGPKSCILPNGTQTTIYVVGIEYPGTEKMLQEATYTKLLNDKEYFARMEKVEEEARKIVSADIPEGEEGEFIEEFAPEQAAKAADAEYHETPTLVEPEEQVDMETGEIISAEQATAQMATQEAQEAQQPPPLMLGGIGSTPEKPKQAAKSPGKNKPSTNRTAVSQPAANQASAGKSSADKSRDDEDFF